MGKYNIGYHGTKESGDIQGIATLTQNPIAIENIRKKVSKSKQSKK